MSIRCEVPYSDAKLIAMLRDCKAEQIFEWSTPLSPTTVMRVSVTGGIEFKMDATVIDHAIKILELARASFIYQDTNAPDDDAVTQPTDT